jgi:hypothetical protein
MATATAHDEILAAVPGSAASVRTRLHAVVSGPSELGECAMSEGSLAQPAQRPPALGSSASEAAPASRPSVRATPRPLLGNAAAVRSAAGGSHTPDQPGPPTVAPTGSPADTEDATALLVSDDDLEPPTRSAAANIVAGRRTGLPGIGRRESVPRQRRRDPASAVADARARLAQVAQRLRSEALPAFQRGLDAVDPGLVQDAGGLVLLLWTAVSAERERLLPPESIRAVDAPELPAVAEIRDAVLSGVTIQRFRGEDLLGPPRRVEYVHDVAGFVATQTDAAASVVGAARELGIRLGRRPLSSDDEEAAVRILASHPNPWQFAYVTAVVRGQGLEHVLQTFGFAAAENLRAVAASQEFLKRRASLGPADRLGIVEPVPLERRVRVLRPYGGGELALELYGDPSFYETLLVPYNRTQLDGLPPTTMVTAGTELLIEPQLVRGRYRMVFMAVETTKRQADRPYIDASPVGAAIVGTKSHYTLRWPLVEPPADAWRTSTGLVLWQPQSRRSDWVRLEWHAENDPSAVGVKGVRADDWLDVQTIATADLNTAGSSVDRSWPVLGTHTITVAVTFPDVYVDPIRLRYPQPVVTAREKLEADWPTVDDTRLDPSLLFAEPAETYGDFQRIAGELGVTEDELAHSPALAGRVSTSYYPEFLLRDLRQQLVGMGPSSRRRKLQYQIDAVEQAIRETRMWGMRPLRALYVSAEDERTVSSPLVLYVSVDPDAPRSSFYPLKLWDFTREGGGRAFTDGHGAVDVRTSLIGLLDRFGDEAPYPTGTVRFAIDSALLPESLAGPYPLAREIYEVHTHGGLLIERLAGGLFTLAVVSVGVLTLGPEVALTAFAIYGAIAGLADILQRLEAGTFEWDIQTGMDILAIAGGLVAGISPVISTVRGVGSVAWLGTTAKATGVVQLGVMTGQHLGRIVKAVESGDADKIAEAVLAAAIDGALMVVILKAGPAPEEGPARGRDPLAEAGGRVRPAGPEGGGGRPSTAAGIAGDRPPPPIGQEPSAAPREGTPLAAHEQWTGRVAERGLSPRPGPATAAGPPVGRGTYESVAGERTFATPERAFAAYDEALTRSGGKEVGVYRNTQSPTSEYIVRVGDEQSVGPPLEGSWEPVLHKHPNPENVLTRRMPAPQDVQNTLHSAVAGGRPVTEFIDYPLPDGRHALVAYTVDPANGRVTIKYEAADGSIVQRTFASLEAYASHYAERTTYVDPTSPEYQWIIRDLHEFYSGRDWQGGSTARGVLKPEATAAAPPVEGVVRTPSAGRRARAEPAARTPAQLERAAQALEQRIETLRGHPDAVKMADELDVIRREFGEGRAADASTRVTELERRVARAELTQASGGLEQVYGTSEEVLGSRVIEYVPSAEGPPVRLDTTTPHPLDTTGQRLLSHVRRAIADAESEGFSTAEARALRTVERSGRSALRDAYRGSHIDRLAKRAVMDDPQLEHVLVTVNFERGADFYDSRTGHWYDITTTGKWKQHVRDYGPSQHGRTTIPGFRLPTEPQ